MSRPLLVFLILFLCLAWGAEPAPLQFADVGDLRLLSGENLREVRVGCRTDGKLYLRTPGWRVLNPDPEDFGTYFTQIPGQTGGLSPVDYVRQRTAIISHDAARTGALVPAMLVFVNREDAVPPEQAQQFARAAGAMLLDLNSGLGHMASSHESKAIAAAAIAFLNR